MGLSVVLLELLVVLDALVVLLMEKYRPGQHHLDWKAMALARLSPFQLALQGQAVRAEQHPEAVLLDHLQLC
jgi:hypothetical protein